MTTVDQGVVGDPVDPVWRRPTSRPELANVSVRTRSGPPTSMPRAERGRPDAAGLPRRRPSVVQRHPHSSSAIDRSRRTRARRPPSTSPVARSGPARQEEEERQRGREVDPQRTEVARALAVEVGGRQRARLEEEQPKRPPQPPVEPEVLRDRLGDEHVRRLAERLIPLAAVGAELTGKVGAAVEAQGRRLSRQSVGVAGEVGGGGRGGHGAAGVGANLRALASVVTTSPLRAWPAERGSR